MKIADFDIKKCVNHIRPKLPKVNPIPQKNANSAKSLHPDGIEFNTALIL